MHIIQEALLCIYSFCATVISSFCILPVINCFISPSKVVPWVSSIILSYALVNAVFSVFTTKHVMQVVMRASLLGSVLIAGSCLSVFGIQHWQIFGWYLCVMSAFHFCDYLCTAISSPKTVTYNAFILPYSSGFAVAAAAAWIEFVVELHYIPHLKNHVYISVTGLVLCIMAEILRKTAIVTLRPSFNHFIQTAKAGDHVLITHGVFNLCRHPGYVGFFYWCIGTQLILVNPLCVVMYIFKSWSFIRQRILLEEKTMLNFFGDEFIKYKNRVRSGFPFFDGIRLEK